MKKILIIIKNFENKINKISNVIAVTRAENINKEKNTFLKNQLKRYGIAANK